MRGHDRPPVLFFFMPLRAASVSGTHLAEKPWKRGQKLCAVALPKAWRHTQLARYQANRNSSKVLIPTGWFIARIYTYNNRYIYVYTNISMCIVIGKNYPYFSSGCLGFYSLESKARDARARGYKCTPATPRARPRKFCRINLALKGNVGGAFYRENREARRSFPPRWLTKRTSTGVGFMSVCMHNMLGGRRRFFDRFLFRFRGV